MKYCEFGSGLDVILKHFFSRALAAHLIAQRSITICAILVEGDMRNITVNLFLNLVQKMSF